MDTRRWSIIAVLVVLTAALFATPGTGDFVNWLRWADAAERLGLRAGFESNHSDYPPLTTLFSWASVRIGRLVGLSPFHSIKLGILLFQIACAAIILAWTRRSGLAIGFVAGSFLNAVPHGYTDVVAAAPFLMGLWTLCQDRPALAAVWLTIAAFTKLQPLAIGPFLVLHVVMRGLEGRTRASFLALVVRVAAPALVVAGVLLWAFGWTATLTAYYRGMTHPELSGNALNFNWLLTHMIRAFHPDYGGLEEGRANWIIDPPTWSMMSARILFATAYISTLVIYARRPTTARNLLTFSLLGYLAFFTFNTGLHENHLFYGFLIAVVLVSMDESARWPAVALAVLLNLNMFLFEGINGDDVLFRRVIARRVDLALPLAVAEVAFFCWFWWHEVSASTPAERPLPAGSTWWMKLRGSLPD